MGYIDRKLLTILIKNSPHESSVICYLPHSDSGLSLFIESQLSGLLRRIDPKCLWTQSGVLPPPPHAYICMFLSYRVVLVQLVPSWVVFAQSPPHSVLQGILWQTLSGCGCLSLIARTWRSLQRNWKPVLHSAHLLGVAHLTGYKGEERNFIQRFC